ncbi:MAG TPA: outer membrane beta-barrel protein [Chitinophagaceae bacterium]|nr:outer membrane beta-barrel protein [Chitinophagaceae bacterium]
MKQIFVFLLTLSFYLIHGQEPKRQKEPKRIFIGFNFSPDYDFRTLKQNDESPSASLVIKSRNDIEIAKFGYTTGLNICINITTFLRLETGIQYSNKGYKTKNQDLIWAPPDPGLPTKSKFIYSYQYIGFPAEAAFIFGKNKIRFLTSVGFMTNFLLKVKQTNILEYSDGRTDKNNQSITGFKKIDISPMISFGIEYKINEKTKVIAAPTFRYGVLKTKDAPITENLWNAGLNIGFYYRLK